MKMIADIRIPDSPLCQAAEELAKTSSEPFLYRHVMRSFVFGSLAGKKSARKYDEEILFLGAVLHDLGLTKNFAADDRFEIDGAEAAAGFLRQQGVAEEKIAIIWDAIALHTTFSVPQYKRPEIALVQIGAGIDVGVVPRDMLREDIIDEILEAYPREGFADAMLKVLADVAQNKPVTAAFNFIEDVAERHVAEYQKVNFCDIVHNAWPASPLSHNGHQHMT